jgi:hypothetical protein
MIRLKLNLRKLTDFRTFTGRDGIEYAAFPIKANAVFMTEKTASLDVTLMDNRDGQDQYGNDGFAVLDVGKERRLAGEKGPIVGNWKDLDGGNQRGGRDVSAAEARQRSAPQQRDNSATEPDDSDDSIPFAPLVNITHF